MFKISIPKPCHQDWNDMRSEDTGRFCSSCAKTVVDFTQMSDEEVKNYLITNASMKICGRFTQNQTSTITVNFPENIFRMRMPRWKQVLVASFIVFSSTLFSCNTNYSHISHNVPVNDTSFVGLMADPDQLMITGKVQADTTPVCTHTMGTPALIDTTSHLMGDVAYIPEKVVKVEKKKKRK